MRTMVLLILLTLLFGAPAVLIGLGSLAALGAVVASSSLVWLAIGLVAAIAIANSVIKQMVNGAGRRDERPQQDYRRYYGSPYRR